MSADLRDARSVDEQLAEVAAVMSASADPAAGAPWDRGDAPATIKVGIDLGTAYTVVVALDAADAVLAGAYERADVVRDGVVVDFLGAVDVVRRLTAQVATRLGRPLDRAQGAYPPGVPASDVRAVRHVIEACDLDCAGLIDEPSAANAVLGLRDGVVVDVGGGTTGLAVVADGQIVHTADEATGGHHLTLVIAGALGVAYDEAERLKCDPSQQARLLPLVRPVMEKVAAIVASHTSGFVVPIIHLVGGSTAFPGFAEAVADASGIPTVRPAHPLFVTPLGIARLAS